MRTVLMCFALVTPGLPRPGSAFRAVAAAEVLSNNARKGVDVDRFRHVAVATRGECLLVVPFHGIRGDGNDDDVAACGIGLEEPRQFKAIHPGKLDVQQDQTWSKY